MTPFILTRTAARSLGSPSLVRQLAVSCASSSNLLQRSTVVRLSQEERSLTATTIYQRSMVMVTKTKALDLPTAEQDTANNSDLSTPVYNNLSDALNVTPSCLNRVERLIQQRQSKENHTNDNYFLRVYVDAGGCSGFTYKFEIDSELDEEEDTIVINLQEGNQPRIVVDENSLGFIRGATIDYVQEMIKSAFEVRDNPQSESACGCGSSFAAKNFQANPALD